MLLYSTYVECFVSVLLYTLLLFSGYERDHRWQQKDWSRLMKSPDASSHHSHLVTRQVWFLSVDVLWHFLYLQGWRCHSLTWVRVKAHLCNNETVKLRAALSALLSLLCCSEPRARSSQSLSWERLKDWNYIALMVDYFELPKRVAEGRRQVLVTRSYSEQEKPLSPRHVCSLRLFFTAEARRDRNEERSGRMLCATSPGECVGTPTL